MQTHRISQTTTISLPPFLYRKALEIAKKEGMTKSELFREALRRFLKEEQEWEALLAYGKTKARQAKIQTEEDVERVIDEGRA